MRIQWGAEMGAKKPLLLLQRGCPPPHDPELLNCLRLVMMLSSSESAVLEVECGFDGSTETYRVGSDAANGPTATFELGETFAATLRLSAATAPDPEMVELLAIGLNRTLECVKLRGQVALLRGALDTTSSSVFLFDDRGDIVYANPPADQLLSLQTEDQLLAEIEDEPRQPLFTLLCLLVERVASAGQVAESWEGTVHIADGTVMACEVTRILESGDHSSGAVLALMRPVGSDSAVRVDAFASSYGLSPREQEVVGLLVQGQTTVAMADQLGISPHTVRDHLKHLYRKTETGSRSELLGLISRASRIAVDNGSC
jgi:DNA-binding CsgD family transcriptional regulator